MGAGGGGLESGIMAGGRGLDMGTICGMVFGSTGVCVTILACLCSIGGVL